MTFTKKEIYSVCKKVAPDFGFEPELLFAFCLQESGRNKAGEFTPDKARLEQGFYIRYVEKQNELATTTEVLLSASYGIMQMMGESLREVGYFDWYFNQQSETMKMFLDNSLSDLSVPKAINAYCVNADLMVLWGAKWLKKKNEKAGGDLKLLCQYWNGDKTGEYYKSLIKKYNSIKNNQDNLGTNFNIPHL